MTTEKTYPGALYLEFEKGPGVTQLLVLPEGVTASNQIVPLTMYRRRISPVQPRKMWRHFTSGVPAATLRARYSSMATPVDNTDLANEMLKQVTPLLNGLVGSAWALRKEPIVVEVTPEDFDDALKAKTPYKVFGRVWKVRKALGFPKDFINEV